LPDNWIEFLNCPHHPSIGKVIIGREKNNWLYDCVHAIGSISLLEKKEKESKILGREKTVDKKIWSGFPIILGPFASVVILSIACSTYSTLSPSNFGSPTPRETPTVKKGSSTFHFNNTPFYIEAVDFISKDLGWAVGEPYWNRNANEFQSAILNTTDGGLTWSTQEINSAETLLSVSFVDTENGWAAGEKGTLVHTTDGGYHWVNQQVSIPSNDLQGIYFISKSEGWVIGDIPTHFDFNGSANEWQASVWHTTDSGNTWETQNLPSSASFLHKIQCLDTHTCWIVGVKNFGKDVDDSPLLAGVVYRLKSDGKTWEEIYSPGKDINLTSLKWIDANTGWVAGYPLDSTLEGGFVFHTIDGGKTWQRQTPGGVLTDIWDIDFLDSMKGYAIGVYGGEGALVYRTRDGGQTWDWISNARGRGLFGISIIGDQFIAMGDDDFYLITTQPWADLPSDYDTGSDLWDFYSLQPHVTVMDYDFPDEQNGWAVSYTTHTNENPSTLAIQHSKDGGKTWVGQYSHNEDGYAIYFTGVSFVDSKNGWVVGTNGDPTCILHTTDGGLHWIEQGQELYDHTMQNCADVQFLDAQHGWVLESSSADGYLRIDHTTDGGNHWTKMNTGFQYHTGKEVSFLDDQKGWIIDESGFVAMTADGGATWSQQMLYCGEESCYDRTNAILMLDDQNGWIGGEGLFHTTDGGRNWKKVDLNYSGDIEDIRFTNRNQGWLATESGQVWYTVNGGLKWQQAEPSGYSAIKGLYFVNAGMRQNWVLENPGFQDVQINP
jgi:photosystem II stability/assembly factor-like uncharacterized protein